VLLKLPIIQRLPPANLQKILIALEEVAAEKGDVIIEQGSVGDYFYFLKSGRCVISRKPAPHSKEIRLGVLEKGEIFGEDALITDAPRTVSVTALTDVTLLRLDKKRFVSLIKAPSLTFINYEELLSLQQEEGASVLDVRTPDEFEKRYIDGSINMPFFSLRMQIKNLNRDKPVIVVCRDGRTSEAGAFFLLKHRYKAFILKGGIESVPEVAEEPVETQDETAGESPDQPEQEDTFELKAQDESYDEQIRKLKTENAALRSVVRQLNEKCNKLDMEKKQIEDRFAILSKHFEQLKLMVQKLKNNA
jgi:rhodanese-related sulfurtransferase